MKTNRRMGWKQAAFDTLPSLTFSSQSPFGSFSACPEIGVYLIFWLSFLTLPLEYCLRLSSVRQTFPFIYHIMLLAPSMRCKCSWYGGSCPPRAQSPCGSGDLSSLLTQLAEHLHFLRYWRSFRNSLVTCFYSLHISYSSNCQLLGTLAMYQTHRQC